MAILLDVSGVPTPMSDAPTLTLAALSRRQALAGALGLGITVEFLGRKAFAAADGAAETRRLVVVICRGGMDGLSVAPPVGDPNYAALRGAIALPGFGQPNGALKLDGAFGLHPALASVHQTGAEGRGADRAGGRQRPTAPAPTSRPRTCWRTAPPPPTGPTPAG